MSKISVQSMLSNVFLAGQTLRDLNFPDDWQYDMTHCRWYSDKHLVEMRRVGRTIGQKTKEYLYITDNMIEKLDK